MRCRTCSTVIPHHARFCPKCGGSAFVSDSASPPRAPDAHPSHTPIPRVGKLFIGSALLGIVLLAAGIAGRNPVLLMIGIGALAVVAVVAIIGHHVS